MRTPLLGATVLFAAATALAQPPERVRVLIGFTELPGPAQEALVRDAGGDIHHRYHLIPAIAATVPVTALSGISRNPNVTIIEPDGLVRAIDAELDNTWGVKRIGSGIVHDGGNRGEGVKVAIVDTGIDCSHPELAPNCMGGIDIVNNDNDPYDDHGHGTHVAGTVAAKDDDSGVVGAAPNALLYGVKVLSASGSGWWSDVAAGIEWCVDNGIQVTNNSYGGSTGGSLLQSAFDNAYAAGIVHVAAAGNSGSGDDTVGYPAKLGSVIAVAATDSNDNRASFSSTGPDVEIAAPGVSIRSTTVGGGYASWSGTSMASPHVAGTVALVIASGVDGPANVRQRLVDTADDLGTAGRDELYGWGLVDADEAASGGEAPPPNEAPVVTISSPLDGDQYDSGATIFFSGTANDLEDGDLSGDLVWMAGSNQIGSGPSFNTTLPDGTHTVTASATDSGAKSGSDSVTVTVTAAEPTPDPASEVTVTSITYRGKGGRNRDKHIDVYVTVTDDLGSPVGGASVAIDLYNGSYIGRLTGTTDSSGNVMVGYKNAPGGCYSSTVVNVNAPPLVWDGNTPANSSCN